MFHIYPVQNISTKSLAAVLWRWNMVEVPSWFKWALLSHGMDYLQYLREQWTLHYIMKL